MNRNMVVANLINIREGLEGEFRQQLGDGELDSPYMQSLYNRLVTVRYAIEYVSSSDGDSI